MLSVTAPPALCRVCWKRLSQDKRTSAILDRIVHRAVVLNIRGPSWRMREHQALVEAARRPEGDGPDQGGARRGR